MAKKKGSGNNKSSTTASQEPRASNAADDAAAAPTTTAAASKAIEDMPVEELRAELLAARAELARVKAAAPLAAPGQLTQTQQPQEVNELHAKLQQLRREQQEADAARDKAWKQLKAVVEEISTLANPEYLQSIVVRPTAAE